MIQRLVVAAPDGWNSPSARLRLGPLAETGLWKVEAVATGYFPRTEQVNRLLDLSGDDAAIVLQRVMPDQHEIRRLRRAFRSVVFDYDDAIYAVPPDLASSSLLTGAKSVLRLMVRGATDASSRRRPLHRTLTEVDACIAGNSILADYARRHTELVVEIPTTVSPIKEPPQMREAPPIVVWEGMLSNMQHLVLVRDALRAVARDIEFRLRIIASANWDDAPIPTEFVPWSIEASRIGLSRATVGLAPLVDDTWTRGKCAFRSIQYGGYGLPTIASPVGITDRVVLHGKTGYLARSTEEWERALRSLLSSPEEITEMGRAALRHIQAHYSNSLAAARWSELFHALSPG
jgi:hypothetical protein